MPKHRPLVKTLSLTQAQYRVSSLFITLLSVSLGLASVGCDDDSSPISGGEQVAGEQVAGEQVAGEQVAGEQVAGEQVAGEQVAGEQVAGEQVAGEQVAGEQFDPLARFGVSAPVEVRFDEVSGLHITCDQIADCFVAQGYYHAAHRFTQMDINRLFPQGRVSERIGNLGLSTDRQSRRLFSRRDGGRIEEQMWSASTDESKQMLEAYARGVNAWLNRWRRGAPDAQLSEEYDFAVFNQDTITDWLPQDSLSVALVLIQDLTESSRAHLNNAQRLTEIGPQLYQDIFGSAPAFPTAVLTGVEGVNEVAGPLSPLPEEKDASDPALQHQALYQRLSSYRDLFNRPAPDVLARWRQPDEESHRPIGSNNWVISPARSASEKAWLSNDPHLGLSNPSVWYLVHMKVREGSSSAPFNVSGVSLPGIPSVIIGHNEHIAWGMTTTYFDFTDVYLDPLTPDGSGVIFQGQEVPFVRREDRFGLADMPDETYETLFVPHHGPVLEIDEERGVAVTMRWTGQDADTDVNFLLGLARAGTVEEAREAIKSVTTIGQNFVIADDQGHIGWFPYNRLPSRPWISAELNPDFPLPGDGSAEWGEPIAYEDLPQLYDPNQGFVVTANHDMTGAFNDGDPIPEAQGDGPERALQEDPDEGYRYSQSTRLVARDEPHDRTSLEDAVHDRESLMARRLLPSLISATDISQLEESGQRLLGVLSAWGEGPRGYDCPAGLTLESLDVAVPVNDSRELIDSAGCYGFHVFYGYLGEAVFADELAAASERDLTPRYEALARLIARPESLIRGVDYWDDISTESEEDAGFIIAMALNSAGRYFNREYGAETETWLWGKVHTVSLSAAIINEAGVRDYNNGPYPNHGGLHTVDVANPRSLYRREFSHTAGASMRFICELTSPPRCGVEIPGGQRHRRESPHYDDLLRRWLDRESTLIPFTDAEVADATIEYIVFPTDLSPLAE